MLVVYMPYMTTVHNAYNNFVIHACWSIDRKISWKSLSTLQLLEGLANIPPITQGKEYYTDEYTTDAK